MSAWDRSHDSSAKKSCQKTCRGIMSATADTKQIELSRLRLCLIIIEVFLPLKLQNLAKKQKESEGQSQ